MLCYFTSLQITKPKFKKNINYSQEKRVEMTLMKRECFLSDFLLNKLTSTQKNKWGNFE